MVVALGPGRFYGSSLPRPRFYTDVKLSGERVDPPLPVLDPFLSWAREAHWSMGGLSFKRHRLQGRIEGSIKKLRAEAEKIDEKRNKEKNMMQLQSGEEDGVVGATPSPRGPTRRQRLAALLDSDSSESEEEAGETKLDVAVPVPGSLSRKRARKLGDEFDRVAAGPRVEIQRSSIEVSPASAASDPMTVDTVSSRTRSRKPTEEVSPLADTEGCPVNELKERIGRKKVVVVRSANGGNAARTSTRRTPRSS